MTTIAIGDTAPRIHYTGDGVQRIFTFPFTILDADDIAVFRDADVINTGFAIAGVGAAEGGSVTFDVAPAEGVCLTLLRRSPLERQTAFQESGEFRAGAINLELNRMVMLLQEMRDRVERALTLPLTEPLSVPLELPLPDPGKALIWNADGTGLSNSPDPVSNVLPPTVAARDAALAAQIAAEAHAAAAAANSATATAAVIAAQAAAASAIGGGLTQGQAIGLSLVLA